MQVRSSSHAKAFLVRFAAEDREQLARSYQPAASATARLRASLQRALTHLSMWLPSLSSWTSLKALKSLLPLWSSCSPAGGHISVSEERMSACCATQRGVSICTVHCSMSVVAAASALHHSSAMKRCLCTDGLQRKSIDKLQEQVSMQKRGELGRCLFNVIARSLAA